MFIGDKKSRLSSEAEQNARRPMRALVFLLLHKAGFCKLRHIYIIVSKNCLANILDLDHYSDKSIVNNI